jgi:hypothetical protein
MVPSLSHRSAVSPNSELWAEIVFESLQQIKKLLERTLKKPIISSIEILSLKVSFSFQLFQSSLREWRPAEDIYLCSDPRSEIESHCD